MRTRLKKGSTLRRIAGCMPSLGCRSVFSRQSVHLVHVRIADPDFMYAGKKQQEPMTKFHHFSIGSLGSLAINRDDDAKERFSGHTLLDIDATVAKPGFKPPISMKSIQNVSRQRWCLFLEP